MATADACASAIPDTARTVWETMIVPLLRAGGQRADWPLHASTAAWLAERDWEAFTRLRAAVSDANVAVGMTHLATLASDPTQHGRVLLVADGAPCRPLYASVKDAVDAWEREKEATATWLPQLPFIDTVPSPASPAPPAPTPTPAEAPSLPSVIRAAWEASIVPLLRAGGQCTAWPMQPAAVAWCTAHHRKEFFRFRGIVAGVNVAVGMAYRARYARDPAYAGRVLLVMDGAPCLPLFESYTAAISAWEARRGTAAWWPQAPFIDVIVPEAASTQERGALLGTFVAS